MAAFGIGREVGLGLSRNPWRGFDNCPIYAPEKLWQRNGSPPDLIPFVSLSACLANLWQPGGAIIFVGALGIAVRAIAPFIGQKREDPAIVLISVDRRFAISVLGGHLAGANSLACHLAQIIGVTPVVTTASDLLTDSQSLDCLLRDCGLKILDWQGLAQIQALLLEKKPVYLFDPLGIAKSCESMLNRTESRDKLPLVCASWRKIPPGSGILRVAPEIHIGIGFRKNISLGQLHHALTDFICKNGFEPAAISALATVNEKSDPVIDLAQERSLDCNFFDASQLAEIATCNPSQAAGYRFDKPPFSVCEGAAMLSAGKHGFVPRLIIEKTIFDRSITLAAAIAIKEA